MKMLFRVSRSFLDDAREDLDRRHPFALERVAFVTVRATRGADHLVLLAESYFPVADEDYVNDPRVGAMMGQEAIRKALEIALLQPVGIFHIHMHGHKGAPAFSRIDVSEQPKFVPDFFKVRPEMPHGALVLSRDRIAGRVWLGPKTVVAIDEFNVIGPQTSYDVPSHPKGRGLIV